jgi:2-methylcitrate dehydratase PrpD
VNSQATQDIAEFAVATSLGDIDEKTQDAASRVVMDTIGVMLAGLTSDVAPPLLTLARRSARPGPANVVGLDICVPAELAAMVNGTLGHALDYDDVIELYPGHPSSVVIGALLASAGPAGLSGADLLTAYIVGVEAGARIGSGLGDGHYARGFHATATIGILAAVAALARIRGFSRRELQRALGIAGSFASGLRGNFGTMTKPLHSGWAARAATVAVDLVSVGFTANEDILDADRGFFATFGDDMSTTAGIKGSLGRPFVFDSPGVGLKRYPCYNGVHRAIDAAREVVQANNVSPDDVAVITCRMPPGRLQAVLYHAPTTGLEAKFSYEYVLAATVLDGSVGIESFTDAAVTRPEVVRLMERVVLIEDPACADGSGTERSRRMGSGGFMRVEIGLRSGEVYAADVARALGSPERPLSWDEVEAKFADCAAAAGVDPDEIGRAARTLRQLPAAADVTGAVRALRGRDISQPAQRSAERPLPSNAEVCGDS